MMKWTNEWVKKGRLASDMDGVLCEDCPPGVDKDRKLYFERVEKARPYLIPSFEIDVIVSNRLEKYRPLTEKWLKEHNVRYKELVLWDEKSGNERNGKFAQHKINALLKIKPDIFWESNFSQAREIWKATKIPVICTDRMVLIGD